MSELALQSLPIPVVLYLLNYRSAPGYDWYTLEEQKTDLIIAFSPKEKFEVLVIDDASPDNTADVCKQLQNKLFSRPSKLGLGSAYKFALRHANGDFIILMDADLSHNPKYIPKFIGKQKERDYDIVTGSRYIKGGGVEGWPMKRIVMSCLANTAAYLLLKPHVSDLTGSFRLYKRSVIEKLMAEISAKGYVFQMEAIFLAQNHDFKIAEIPIVFVDRLYGSSKLELSMQSLSLGKKFYSPSTIIEDAAIIPAFLLSIYFNDKSSHLLPIKK